MAEDLRLDPLILGRRLRHYRRRAGLTLDGLGERVNKPAPYLSLLENGKKEPRLSLILDLASALEVEVGDLLDPTPPTRRDALEIALIRAQETPLFASLDLPPVRPSAKMDNETLAHLVGLHQALRERSGLGGAESKEVRRANASVASEVAARDGYLEHVEEVARQALKAANYSGDGPMASRNLFDLAASIGYEIRPVDGMPPMVRSIIDTQNHRIYIAQRDELRTRQARKAVLQTLAGFLLDHQPEPELETFLRQRVETAYFAAAVLVPEEAVVPKLEAAKKQFDIDVEDIKELFYVSYEMAAWRTVNLLTNHLEIRSHLLVSDEAGMVVKGYTNDGLPVPRDRYGGMESQRLCRWWGARTTFDSPDRFGTHHQYTDTPEGTFFCTTHVAADKEHHAVTVGVRFPDARWFRGRETNNRVQSTCPDPHCCRLPSPKVAARWEGKVIVSARSQQRLLGLLTPDPYPEPDMLQVLKVVEEHAEDT